MIEVLDLKSFMCFHALIIITDYTKDVYIIWLRTHRVTGEHTVASHGWGHADECAMCVLVNSYVFGWITCFLMLIYTCVQFKGVRSYVLRRPALSPLDDSGCGGELWNEPSLNGRNWKGRRTSICAIVVVVVVWLRDGADGQPLRRFSSIRPTSKCKSLISIFLEERLMTCVNFYGSRNDAGMCDAALDERVWMAYGKMIVARWWIVSKELLLIMMLPEFGPLFLGK